MALDWNKLSALLAVIHSAAAAGPKFTKYASAANAELEAMWDEENPKEESEVDDEPDANPGPRPASGRRV